MTIRDQLDALDPQARRRLQYAFEQGMSQIVTLPDDRFIGVNADCIKHIEIEQTAGSWAIGKMRRPE